MSRAAHIVYALLEGDPDEIDTRNYLHRANDWTQLDLIISKDWRQYVRALGWRVKSLYRYTSKGDRKYADLSLTLVPADGHRVDAHDALLIRDYLYEFIERKFGKKRSEMDYIVDAHEYSGDYNGVMLNYVQVFIRTRDSQDRIQWQYLD